MNTFSAVERFTCLEVRWQRRALQGLDIEAAVVARHVIVRDRHVERVGHHDPLGIRIPHGESPDDDVCETGVAMPVASWYVPRFTRMTSLGPAAATAAPMVVRQPFAPEGSTHHSAADAREQLNPTIETVNRSW
jgi:hypothetical protein